MGTDSFNGTEIPIPPIGFVFKYRKKVGSHLTEILKLSTKEYDLKGEIFEVGMGFASTALQTILKSL